MKIVFTTLVAAALISTSASAAVLATVNDKPITSDEVNAVLMEGTQGRFTTLPKEKQYELKKRVIEGIITQELVYSDAKKTGVLDSKEYKTELQAVLVRIEKQLAAKVWEKKQFEKVKVSDAEVKAYFDSHTEEFIEKEKVHARHILVKTESDAKGILKKLNGLHGEVLKSKFIELAKSDSTGPSGPKGGDLGLFPQGQMVPEFNDAVFKMKVGTITPKAVKTQFGYHVIYLESKAEEKPSAYEQVKEKIIATLKQQQFAAKITEVAKELKSKAKIVDITAKENSQK